MLARRARGAVAAGSAALSLRHQPQLAANRLPVGPTAAGRPTTDADELRAYPSEDSEDC